MNIGELFVKLGFKADTKELNTMQSGLNNAKLGAIALTAGITAAIYAINNLISASLQSAVALKNFEVQTGLSREQLQKWSYVAEQNDVSAQSLINSIKGIQKAQANLRMGQGNIKPFALLGISPTEDPFTVLDKLKNRIKGLEPVIASSLLSQLGVGDDMLNLLRNSNLEFEKLNKQFLLTSKEQGKLIDLNKSYKDFIFTLRGIRDRLVAMISPQVMDFIKAIKNNFEAFFVIGKGLLDLIDRFKWLGKTIAIVGAIVLAIFAPWTAVITGIILVVDDLWVMFQGGESVLGGIFQWFMKFEIVRNIVNTIKTASLLLFDSFISGIDIISQFYKKFTDFENLKNIFNTIVSPLKILFESLKLGINIVSEFIKKFTGLEIIKDIFVSLMEPLKLFFETLKSVWGFIGKLVGKGTEKLFDIDFKGLKDKIGIGIDSEQKRIPGGIDGGSNTANTNTINNINIVVDGASGDGNKIAFNIKEALSKQMDKAYYTAATGV